MTDRQGSLEGRAIILVVERDPPEEKRQAIFRPYYRLPDAAAEAPEGLGLGLAISRELIRQMGGDIVVVSEPGAGSTFTITLPAASA